MRISLQELLVIHPFCLHSSVAWFIYTLKCYIILSHGKSREKHSSFALYPPQKIIIRIKLSWYLGISRERNKMCTLELQLAAGSGQWGSQCWQKVTMPIQLYSNVDLRDSSLASQMLDILRTCSSGWPLSQSGLLLFPGSKPLLFHLYIIVREIDSCIVP